MTPEEFYNLFKLCMFSYLASLLITISVILIKYQNLSLILNQNSNYLVCQENYKFFILETF
jgi:hypothetical protein